MTCHKKKVQKKKKQLKKKERLREKKMDTILFGPLWLFLHFYAYFLPKGPVPKEIVESFISFVDSFCFLIPCGGCSNHAASYFLQNIYALKASKTGQEIFEWTVTFHNHVNKMLQRRIFSFLEAESALLMHLTGKSKIQFEIEDKHTIYLQKIRKLEEKMLILQNKSQKIKPISLADLTSGLDIEITQTQHLYEFVFHALFLIALEKNQDTPLTQPNVQACTNLILRSAQLFPNLKIAQDTELFLKSNPPNLHIGTDFFAFVLQWKNHVFGEHKTSKETYASIQAWAKEQQQRSRVVLTNAKEEQKKSITLKQKYAAMLEERKQKDASDNSTNDTNNTLMYTFAVTSVILLVISIVFIILYSKEKKRKK